MSSSPSMQEKNPLDRTESQPALPVVHRRFANPAPLGLFAFATSLMLISFFGVGARGVTVSNVIVGPFVFFGGICQYISGIMEYISGNTFGYTVFLTFGSFNIAYAMIFIPGSGILEAYTDPTTHLPTPQFNQALSLFIWPFFILAVIFTVATTRSSWVLLIALATVSLEFLLLATGLMVGNEQVILASRGVGFVCAFFVYWAATAGMWGSGVTRFNVPVGSLVPRGRVD